LFQSCNSENRIFAVCFTIIFYKVKKVIFGEIKLKKLDKKKRIWSLILFLLCWGFPTVGSCAGFDSTTDADTSSLIRLYLCPDSTSIVITADPASSYSWSTGAHTRSITVSEAGIYTVTTTFHQIPSVKSYLVSNVLMSPVNSISLPDMCAGDSYTITVGHDSTNSVFLGSHEAVQTWTDTVFLPDGVYCEPYGCSYRSPLTFTSFSDNAVISSANDILYVRLNIEHSYASDLYINLTCPNGQKANILRFGGSPNSSCSSTIPPSSKGWQSGSNASGSTFFGQAYDNNDYSDKCNPDLPLNAPGIGWNYCWSNNTTENYTYAPGAGSLIYRSANVHSYPAAFYTYNSTVSIFDSSNVAAGTHFYHPDQSFSSLIGCPLNGDWYIEVMDGWSVDNGYLFEWELALSSDIQNLYTDVDSTSMEGPWATSLNDSTLVITPPDDLPQDTTVSYVFHFFSEYGCEKDSTVFIDVFAVDQTVIDTAACDSIRWDGILYTSSYTRVDTLTNFHGCDSLVILNLTILKPSYADETQIVCDSIVWNDSTYYESGDYTYLCQNQQGCDSLTKLHLTVHQSCHIDIYDTACDYFVWNNILYEESGLYTQSFINHNHCDSIVTLHLTIHSSNNTILNELACDEFTWEGSTYYESGTYTKVYSNVYGCDSVVKLQLTILNSDSADIYQTACDSVSWNNVTYYGSGDFVIPMQKINGCDSLMNLHFTIWNSNYIEKYETACDSFYWNGTYYYESGDYPLFSQNEHGCDSINVLHLTIWNSDYVDLYETACDSFLWNSTLYYETGDYTQVYKNIHGCDSIETLHLTIWNSWFIEQSDTVCDSITWNNITYYESGNYVYYTETSNGCDSIETLHLTVYYSNQKDVYDTACDGYVWNDSTYHESGIYTKHFLNINGCDSVVTLHLSLGYSDYSELFDTVCDSYVWNDSIYDVTGDYTQSFQNIDGCDSTVVLHLVVHYTNQTVLYDTACDYYVWNDTTYYESGDYVQSFQNIDGCDSIVTLHLMIGHSDLFVDERAACDSLYWNDSMYYESGDYIFNYQNMDGCDSTIILHLVIMSTTPISWAESVCDSIVWNDSTYYESGDYIQVFPSAEGCDSVVTLHLTVHPSTDTLLIVEVYENGMPYVLNGVTYDTAGTYIQTISNTAGCDSVITLQLTVIFPETPLSVLSYKIDNTHCDGIPGMDDSSGSTCNGRAFVSPEGGIPPYFYSWDDPLAQQTDTAFHLCAGVYTVTVTDIAGDTLSAQITISDYQPKVDHDNAHFCFSDSFAVLEGMPAGGFYSGAIFHNDTLVFQENVTDYQLTYTYSDEHTCTGSTPFQVSVTMNTRTEDTMICSNRLPYLWYGQSLSSSGTYQAQTPMDTLCDSLITLHLTVLQQPHLTVNENLVINPGEITTLSVSGANSYLWDPAATLSSVTSANPTASPTQSTMYHVTGFSSSECYTTDSVKVLIRQYLDTTVCESALPFQWYGITITDTTTQSVTIPKPNGLDDVFVLQVHLLSNSYSSIYDTVMENDLPFVFNGTTFYNEVSDSLLVIPNSNGCDSVIHYSLYVCRNQTTMMDSTACMSHLPLYWNNQQLWGEGTYQADLQTSCGSDSLVMLHLSVIDTALRIISITEDFCDNMSAELSVITELTDYVWSTGETTPQITVTQPGLYSITAFQGDCSSSAEYLIKSCPFQIYLPNAISPFRTDGLNDYFCIPEFYLRNINQFEISIFNRWGDQVFYSTDKHFKWNGEVKGSISHNIVYNYVIRFTSNVGTPYVITGTVTIL